MSSKRRRAASRANGKKSLGPVTPEGKARSAANAVRHGLASTGRLAASVCLTNESRIEFEALHEALIAELKPCTATECLTVEEMAVCRWRLQRAWVIETALVDNQMDGMTDGVAKDYEAVDEPTRVALAIRELTKTSTSLDVVNRYDARLSRQFDRCLKRLTSLRAIRNTEIPNDPNPTNEHSQPTSQFPIERSAAEAKPAIRPHREPEPVASSPAPEVEEIRLPIWLSDPEPLPGIPHRIPRAA